MDSYARLSLLLILFIGCSVWQRAKCLVKTLWNLKFSQSFWITEQLYSHWHPWWRSMSRRDSFIPAYSPLPNIFFINCSALNHTTESPAQIRGNKNITSHTWACKLRGENHLCTGPVFRSCLHPALHHTSCLKRRSGEQNQLIFTLSNSESPVPRNTPCSATGMLR